MLHQGRLRLAGNVRVQRNAAAQVVLMLKTTCHDDAKNIQISPPKLMQRLAAGGSRAA